MHSKLILEAFEKAIALEAEMGVVAPSKSKAAKRLSDFIDSEMNFQFGERRLRDHYNEALQGGQIELKQRAVRNGLAKFLDYRDYSDFQMRNGENKKFPPKENDLDSSETSRNFMGTFFRRNRTTVIVIICCIVLFFVFNAIHKEKWMTWNGDRYTETDFEPGGVENGQIMLFNPSQVERFRKVRPDCDSKFFNSKGDPIIWYGKNPNGDLEYFTDVGKHPETRKTLKPITKYMIDKYICR